MLPKIEIWQKTVTFLVMFHVTKLILPYRRYDSDQVSNFCVVGLFLFIPLKHYKIKSFIRSRLELLFRVTSAQLWLATTNSFGIIHFRHSSERLAQLLSDFDVYMLIIANFVSLLEKNFNWLMKINSSISLSNWNMKWF